MWRLSNLVYGKKSIFQDFGALKETFVISGSSREVEHIHFDFILFCRYDILSFQLFCHLEQLKTKDIISKSLRGKWRPPWFKKQWKLRLSTLIVDGKNKVFQVFGSFERYGWQLMGKIASGRFYVVLKAAFVFNDSWCEA